MEVLAAAGKGDDETPSVASAPASAGGGGQHGAPSEGPSQTMPEKQASSGTASGRTEPAAVTVASG